MINEILLAVWYLLAAVIVLVLPGLAWYAWRSPAQFDPLEHLANWIGVSISLTAGLALVGFLLDISISGLALGGVYIGLAVAAGFGFWRHKPTPHFSTLIAAGLGGLFLLGMIAWRFYQARDLALPAWVDSVHHALIVRQIFEKGGLPADLLPDIPVPFYYHYGFHSLAAIFTALTKLSVDQAVLIFGQILNALVGLSVYRLAKAVWRDSPQATGRAVGAALLVTFVTHMPAYYLTWGRYTLLTGLVVLPVAMAQALELVRTGAGNQAWRIDWRTTASLAILTAGVLLSHYLTGILLAIYLVILAVGLAWRDWRGKSLTRSVWAGLVVGVGLGTVWAAPWLARIWVFSQASFQVSINLTANAPDQVYYPNYVSFLVYLLGPAHSYAVLGLGALGMGWVYFRGIERTKALHLAVWGSMICLLTIPWGLRLGPFRPDHMAIVLFIPAAMLASHLLFSASEALQQVSRGKIAGWCGAALTLSMLCGWGISRTASVLNYATVFADAADRKAVAWVGQNTPLEAVFWVNVTPWQGQVYRGTDGGWWILPLTGRQTLLPPVPYTWGSPEYQGVIRDLAIRSNSLTGCDEEFWSVMQAGSVDYVYLHAGKGSLQPESVKACAGLTPVYQEGGVVIYKIDPGE